MLVKSMLNELGLNSWLKTSGGKGMHVVMPILPRDGWDVVKDFAHAMTSHLARTIPSRLTDKSGPKEPRRPHCCRLPAQRREPDHVGSILFTSPTWIEKSSNPKGQAMRTNKLQLDVQAIQRAAHEQLEDGPVTPGFGPWREDVIALLNGALATELVCVLRYKRHHFTAKGLVSPSIAQELMAHAQAEATHADLLAARIVQLGGEPDFDPATFASRSHAAFDASKHLNDMLRADLVAERIAVESYRQMIGLIGDKDPTTRRILETILADEEEHAEELADLLSNDSGQLIPSARHEGDVKHPARRAG